MLQAASLSRRASAIKPSATLAMNQRAAALKRAGKSVIPLSLGEPDFDTPAHVKSAALVAIERNFTKYTASEGTIELRQALCEKLGNDNGLDLSPEQVVVGSGAKIILLATLMSIIDSGDEVILPAPFWVSYPDLAAIAGGLAKPVWCAEHDGFKLTPQALEGAITPRSRVVILNSPNNPTGAVYTEQELRNLASVIARHPRLWVVTDELYEHIVFDGRLASSFANVAPELFDRVVTINGFSKGYVMTGWRLGFAAGPKNVVAAIGNLLSQMHGSPNSISQAAAVAALEGDPTFIEENRATFSKRRDLVVEWINRTAHLRMLRPQGTFYAFPNCADMLGRVRNNGETLCTDLDVAEALIEDAGVAVVPGTVFGAPSYFRISYALDAGLIEEAMSRIETFARGLKLRTNLKENLQCD